MATTTSENAASTATVVSPPVSPEKATTTGWLSPFGIKYRAHMPMHSFAIPYGQYGFLAWDNVRTVPHRIYNYFHSKKQQQDTNASKEPKNDAPHDAPHDEPHHDDHKPMMQEHKEIGVMTMEKVPGVRYPHLIVRMLTLLLLFLAVMGPSMSYSLVSALSSNLMHEYGVTGEQIALLFSVYSLPNIVAVFIAGFLTDKLGMNIVLLACATFFLVGNLITLGNNYWCMLVGRIIYGVGTECVGVVQSAILAKWYSFDTTIPLSMATAVFLVAYRASGFIMMFAFPPLASVTSLQVVLIVINVCVLISAVSCVTVVILNRVFDRYLHLHDPAPTATVQNRLKQALSCLTLDHWFWVLSMTCIFYYGAVLTFMSYAPLYYAAKFDYSPAVSSIISSVLYGISGVLIVPMGTIVDRLGHRLTINVIGISFAMIAFLLLTFTSVTPWVAASLLGISYSIVPAVIFPMFPLIVNETKLGVAYGFNTAKYNLTLFVLPLIIGYIPGYFYQNLTLFLLLGLALLGSILLWIMDRCLQKGKIEMTCVQRKMPNNAQQRKSVWHWMKKYLKQKEAEDHHGTPHVELQTPRASLELNSRGSLDLNSRGSLDLDQNQHIKPDTKV